MNKELLEQIKNTFEGRGFKGEIIPYKEDFMLRVNKEISWGTEVNINFYPDGEILVSYPSKTKNPEEAFQFRQLYNDAMDCLTASLIYIENFKKRSENDTH